MLKISHYTLFFILVFCISPYSLKSHADPVKPSETILRGSWKRGSIHTHTYWSDGRGFPEQTVGTFKRLGYDFVCFTDHDILSADTNFWLPVRGNEGHWPPMVTTERFNDYRKNYPDMVETRRISYHTLVRLKPFAEIKAKMEEPGKFLIIGGEEFTGSKIYPDGRRYDIHMNLLNIEKTIPLPPMGTVEEILARYIDAYQKATAGWPHETLVMINHPQWKYWDVQPHQIADLPLVRHFEVYNGGLQYKPADGMPNIERFWDVVNAFRAEKNVPLLLGAGTDDSHFYDPQRIHNVDGCGNAWVMVHCPGDFTIDRVMAAMNRGDYYASNGVELNSIVFANGKLRVSVAARDGVSYRITFVGTKRGFNHEWKQVDFECPEEKVRKEARRSLRFYSADIGKVLQATDGTEAEYTLSPDDLYVRAIIDSDAPAPVKNHAHGAPKNAKAWTQPYRP